MTIRQWVSQDNSMKRQKAQLRVKNLPQSARVLDLFCGNGEMYREAYQGRVEYYHGVDKEKVHDSELCTWTDNLLFLKHTHIDSYNVFDLDAYGCPRKQLYFVLKKLKRADATIFITDGLVMHQKVDRQVTKFVSATEQIPRKFNVPGLNRWYEDIFATMLLDIERRYGWKTTNAQYFYNERRTVYYWCIKLKKEL